MLAWWLAYLLVRNTFYIDTLRNTTSATFFALLHFSLQIFTPHLYTGDYKLWVWGGFAQPTKPSSNNSLLNGRSNQDIRSWFTFQKKQRITNNVFFQAIQLNKYFIHFSGCFVVWGQNFPFKFGFMGLDEGCYWLRRENNLRLARSSREMGSRLLEFIAFITFSTSV